MKEILMETNRSCKCVCFKQDGSWSQRVENGKLKSYSLILSNPIFVILVPVIQFATISEEIVIDSEDGIYTRKRLKTSNANISIIQLE